MRFDDRVTGNVKTYAPNAKKIHIDIDPAEINKNVRVDVALVGDLGETLARVLQDVPAGQPAARGSTHIASLKGDAAVRDIKNLPDSGHLYAAHVIHDLWRETDGQRARRHRRRPAPDVGGAVLPPRARRARCITSGGLGTMGFALPAAIGAKMARPDAEVWVVVGDGGFQMTMAELATVVQEELDINIAIINNGYLGHGAAVAGVLLRPPLRRHADAEPRLRARSPRPTASRRARVEHARGRGARRAGGARAQGHRC